MRLRTKVVVASTLLLGAIALGTRSALNLTINGKPCAPPPIEQEGEVYVPLSMLKAAGAEVAKAGDRVTVRFIPVPGAVQVDAVEGGLDEWLTNGVWRLRVSNPRTEDKIFKVDVEIRNATKVALSPAVTTGIKWPEMYSAEGGKMDSLPRSDRGWTEIESPELPPGASGKRTLEYWVKEGETPEKLLVRFELTATRESLMKKKGVAFLGPAKNFRVFLKSLKASSPQ